MRTGAFSELRAHFQSRREGPEDWRRALKARVRSAPMRASSNIVAATLAGVLYQSLQSALLLGAWLVVALGLMLVETRWHRHILRRRLDPSPRDRVVAILATVLYGLGNALFYAALVLSDEPGTRGLAALCFMTLAASNLVPLRDTRALYYACILPPFAGLLGPGLYVLATGHATFGAALATLALALVVMSQLGLVAARFSEQTRSMRDARRVADAAARTAQSANRVKSDFLAVMTHELRTPMNAMLGSAELLRRTDLTLEQRSQLEALTQSGELLLTLLNDMLDMSRIEAGAFKTESIPVHLPRMVEGLQNVWRPRAADNMLSLHVEVEDGLPPWVMADPTRMRQILFNLLSNAVKFTPAGAITLRFASSSEDGRDWLVIEVEDTGPGITPDVAARLFQPFQQADVSTARRFGGSGLGLSICRGLCRSMGGEIHLRSEVGKGSTFKVRLPLQVAEPQADADDPDLDVSLDKVQVLVVEDNPANRRLIGALLQPLGLEVIMACNGREAVDLFKLDMFDVVLMDMHMPVLDGLEATREIRSLSGWGAQAPIIALTANSSESDRKKCFEAGMTAFMSKPIDPRALHALIARAVTYRSSQAMLAAAA
jgi:two-component system, sensor histidine kinase